MAIVTTARVQTISSTSHGTGTFTCGSFTPSNNSLLVVFVQELGNATGDFGTPTITDSLGTPLTYTPQAHSFYTPVFAQSCTCFTAPVGTGASQTITVDDNLNRLVYQWVITVVDCTGYNTGTPVGGTAVSTADIGDGAETQTLSAAPATDDVTFAFLGVDDSGSAATPTYGAGSWASIYNGVSNIGGSLGVRTASTSSSVPITDVYTGAGGYDKELMMSVVIKAAAGAVTSADVRNRRRRQWLIPHTAWRHR